MAILPEYAFGGYRKISPSQAKNIAENFWEY
jgi:hypothetical protein